MGTVETFTQNMREANPRLALVPDNATGVPALGCPIHRTLQPLPAEGETELGRFQFLGKVFAGVAVDSGYPMRMVVGPGATVDPGTDSISSTLVDVVTGAGIIVATDRRLFGTMVGDSSLFDLGRGSGRSLWFSMAYDDIEQMTLQRKTGMLGGTKERSMNVLGLNPLGALNFEVDGVLTLHEAHATPQKERSARRLFETASVAAARQKLATATTDGERRQLEAVAAGRYEADGQDLVAELNDPDV